MLLHTITYMYAPVCLIYCTFSWLCARITSNKGGALGSTTNPTAVIWESFAHNTHTYSPFSSYFRQRLDSLGLFIYIHTYIYIYVVHIPHIEVMRMSTTFLERMTTLWVVLPLYYCDERCVSLSHISIRLVRRSFSPRRSVYGGFLYVREIYILRKHKRSSKDYKIKITKRAFGSMVVAEFVDFTRRCDLKTKQKLLKNL